jgi:hypothetical protein
VRLVGAQDSQFTRLGVASLHDVAAGAIDGRPIVVVAGEQTLRVIDAVDGSLIREVKLKLGETPQRIRIIDHSGSHALFGTTPYRARLWTLPGLELVTSWRARRRALIDEWDWCGNGVVAAAVQGGGVRLLDVTTGREVGPRIRARDNGRRWLRRAATALTLDSKKAMMRQVQRSLEDKFWSVATHGGLLFAGDYYGSIWRWRMPSGELVGSWPGLHHGPVVRISTYAVGDRVVLATIGSDMAFSVWDGETGQRIGEPIHMSEDMPRVAAVGAVDGVRHLLVSGDLMVRRVDPRTGVLEVVARWETDDGQPRDEYGIFMEEICTVNDGDRWLAFVVTSRDIWRIDAETGEPA